MGDGELRVTDMSGHADPSRVATLPADVTPTRLQAMYRAMVTARVLEERATALQRQGRIGFYIGSLGQEAAHVGSAAALRPEDWVFGAYREVGVALWRGASPRILMAQCLGTANDPSRGRQMPCHYAMRHINFASVSSPIGTHITHAVGVGLAMRYRRTDSCAIAFFGDGATSCNDFHAGLNFAGVFKAPVIFFCVNNQYAISMHVSHQTASETLAAKAAAYGMPGVRVDGTDVLAVYRAAHAAAARARAGEGPTLIEAVTYRLGPHSTSDDPSRYRADVEAGPWRERDPLAGTRMLLEQVADWNAVADKALWDSVRQEVLEAIADESRATAPPLNSLFEDVYARVPANLEAQRAELLRSGSSEPVSTESDEYHFP